MKARYKKVVDGLAQAIRNGTLLPGARLPTHRNLSIQEGISLATATRVYKELEAMGLVSGEVGRGTFVREISLPPGLGVDQEVTAMGVLDLNFNYPALPFQSELLRDSLRQLTTSGDIEALLRYQPHGGRLHERAIIAGYLKDRGLNIDAEDVLIVNGAQHGLCISLMGLLRPGDVIAADALTYPGFKILAEMLHVELVAIPSRGEGADLNYLRNLCQRRPLKAVYTMPTMHNPLGWVVSLEHRKTLADMAREFNFTIIEDAAYAYLAEQSPPPLVAFAPEKTVYISGFSKNIATGLRVGVVVCPAEKRGLLERAIRVTTWNTPALMTAIISGWLQDGTIGMLEDFKRKDAMQRQSLAREIFGTLPYISHPNAYFIWLPLAEEVRADRVVKQLINENISVSTADPYSIAANTPQAIRLALGSVSLENLEKALRRVKEIIEFNQYL